MAVAVVTPTMIVTLRNARKMLAGIDGTDAKALVDRCDRLLTRLARGQHRTPCEISNELRAIIDDTEELLRV